jgi:hypothetical protein
MALIIIGDKNMIRFNFKPSQLQILCYKQFHMADDIKLTLDVDAKDAEIPL